MLLIHVSELSATSWQIRLSTESIELSCFWRLCGGVQPQMLDAMSRMIPLGRGGTPEEAADAVYLFCSPESNYISGQVVVAGGGLLT